MSNDFHVCPVCGYPKMTQPHIDIHGASTFYICPCCGIEFGYEDANHSHQYLREKWLAQGGKWFSQAADPPENWSVERQLAEAGLSTPKAH